MPDGFRSIKEIIKSEPALKHIQNMVDDKTVMDNFQILFSEWKAVAKAVKFSKGTLTLRVENPAWRSELKLKEQQIMDKINSFYKEEKVNKIRFSQK